MSNQLTKPRKATHVGECQACGCTQKLPAGALSLHGYTKQWGFFAGICQGAGHLPLELSKDLIESCIQKAAIHLESLNEEYRTVGAYTGGEKIFVHIFNSPRDRRGYYTWEEVTLMHVATPRPDIADDYVSHVFTFEHGGKTHDLRRTGSIHIFPKSIEEAHAALSSKYREANLRRLDQEMASVHQYIKWQQGRIANWKPKKLKPVK